MRYAVYGKRIGAIVAGLCLAAAWALAGDSVVEEIVARVNSQIITRSELERSREQMLAEAQQQHISETEPRVQENEKNLLRDLIDQQLLVQKGADLGITGDTELIKKLDELRKQMNLDSMEDLEKAAKAQGVSFEEFKQNLKNNIITQEVIRNEVGGHIQITGDEIKQFYQQHQSDFAQPEQVRLSEILVAPEAKAGGEPAPEALDAAQQKAQHALAEIKAGKSFAEVAKQVSSGPTAEQGGDLGYFKRGTLSKELEDKTFAMKPGEVSDVVRTKQGFIVLKVAEHQAEGVPPQKELEPRIQEAIYMQKLQPQLRDYLTKLREEAFVDVRSGYVDTGASPRQTQPVYTATAQPLDSQKAKKKKKFGIF